MRILPQFIFVALASLAVDPSALAQAIAAPGLPAPVSAPDPRSRLDGDFSKRYLAASSELAHLKGYLTYHLSEMEKLKVQYQNSPGKWDQVIKSNLGDFCLQGQPLQVCYDFWVLVQNQTLQALDGEISQKNELIAILRDDKSTRGRSFSQGRFSNQNTENLLKTPTVASVHSLEELNQIYNEKMARQDILIREDYVKFAASIPQPPVREDFVMFKTRKSSSIPSFSQFLELDRSCNAPICYDEAAFEAAMIDYEVRLKKLKPMLEDIMVRAPASVQNPLAQYPKTISPVSAERKAAVERTEKELKAGLENQKKSSNPNTDLFVQVDPGRRSLLNGN